MFESKICRRLVFSLLFLTVVSLTVLGFYLLHFFYSENLQNKTNELTINGRIIETAIAGLLQENASAEELHDKIQQISSASDLRITIVDPGGKVIADSSEPAENLDNHLSRQEVQAALQTGAGRSIRYSDTLLENMLYVALPVWQDGKLLAIVRTASSLTPLENSYAHIRHAVFFAQCASALTAILFGFWLAWREIRPIQQMTATAQEITNGNLAKRVHIHTDDELQVLAQTINNLTNNLSQKIKEAQSETHKLALILENMDNAVMLLDEQGNITTANRQAYHLFRLTPDLMRKHSINAIGNTLLSSTAQEVLQSGEARSITFHIKLKSQEKTFAVFFAPFRQDDANAVLSVFHDISMLQEVADRQAKFVANAAHELATPLTSICGFAETLLDTDLKDAALNKKFITIIYKESQRMSRLIKDLLQLAKLDSKEYREQLQLSTVDCRALFTAVGNKLQNQIAQKKLTLAMNLPDTAALIRVNEDLMLQLILNLTENAIKYTPENGRITLTCQTDEKKVRLLIEDTGIGIAPADIPLIFERFYRADKARSRAFGCGGSGIGLSLVQFFVRLFGGKITVKSALQIGTKFTIELPRIPE